MRLHPAHPSWLAAALVVVGLTSACKEKDNPVPGDVQGTWALAEDSAGAVVLRIQGNDLVVFRQNAIGDCYRRTDYTIIRPDGIDFRITDGQDTLDIEMQRDGESLLVSAFGDEAEYVAISFDPETLTICEPPEVDAECAALPALTIGSEVADSLDETDPRTYLGTRYQLYALDAGAPRELVVFMSSTDVDSYLSLYDSTGAFLEANDDETSLTFDARLQATLDAGCYILMATTAEADELGEFELEVALP